MMYHSHVLVCAGTGCTSSNSLQIIENFQRLLAEKGYDKEIQVIRTGCFGLCAAGPIVVVYPAGVYYSHVTPDDVEEIVNEHLIKGRPVQRLIYKEMDEKGVNTTLNESDFYKKQHRIALRNCGLIDPENIDEYIAFDGYKALEKCLTQLSRDDVVDMVVASGLRGRGGGGFPTGLKWKFAKAPESDVKYVCCNADEGDPGAFMDRSVLEGDPHSVLEAMTIAGYCIGAQQGYIYVRAEYPIAVKRLRIAIDCWAITSWARASSSTSTCAWAAAPLYAARRRPCWPPSRATGASPGPVRPSRRSRACGASPPCSTTWRPMPTSARSSSTGRNGSPPWARRRARAPRCSPWAVRSTTPAWWRSPWAPPCGRSSTISAAASPMAKSSRLPRPAAPPAAASRRNIWISPSTMIT